MTQKTRRKARTKKVMEDAIESIKNDGGEMKCKNQFKEKQYGTNVKTSTRKTRMRARQARTKKGMKKDAIETMKNDEDEKGKYDNQSKKRNNVRTRK